MQKFSRFLVLLVVVLTCGIFAQAETLTPRKGVIRVKLQEQVATKLGVDAHFATKGVMSTGIHTLDVASQKVKATSIRRVFPYSPKHEAQMALYGLDRWYEVSFDESVNPMEAKAIFGSTAGVQVATCKVPMVLKEGKGEFTKINPLSVAERPSTMPFNDPRLSSQWHYNNTGTLSGSKVGADINLFEAWKSTTGSKNVIVAIIDGGIDYTHEDLAGNFFYNEAEQNGVAGVDDDQNGYVDDVYGWNFCTNNKDVYPHSHGTHVAGTVAAVNNNGIGVCGVAGGDGTPGSGVSLLSVQVFDSRSGSGEGDFAAAIVYAANRGASIANCSWGWATDGYYEQDVLDAIDYFIGTKATNENDIASVKAQRNLTGGVMFFATGNDGAFGNFYPACYEPVVAVGSMTNDYTVASYSNHGTWVDIVAPGGLLDYGNAGGVLSTLPNNEYGFNEGTSMATPHVTGIAALVVSMHGNETMPAETIRQQIITSVNDLYVYNEGKEGLHGAGYIDAVKALQMNPEGESPEAVASFTALPAQDNITIEWVIPTSSTGNVNHHVLYYSTEEFTAESDLTTLNKAIIDTKFAVSGDVYTYELAGLSPLTTYYLAMTAVDRWGNASALSPIVSATTNAGPKMTVDKKSLSMTIDAASSLVGTTVFNIGNSDEGLLKWTGKIATKSFTMATKSTTKPVAGLNGKLKSRLGATPYAANEKMSTEDFVKGDYPVRFSYYKEYWASIGESDKSLPNSQAQWFYVDKTSYPNGFNLTNLEISSTYGQDPIIQIYDGSSAINSATLLQEIKPSYFYNGYQIALTEQLYFAPGESFWAVVHFPAESNQDNYPLGLANADAAYGSYSYMSNDMGKTWLPLVDALKGSPYEAMGSEVSWAITAISKNPAWDQVFTLSPSEGSVKQGETQAVNMTNDGQKLVNGTYKFNVGFNTNESEKNNIVVAVSVTVKNNPPEMAPVKVVNFGSLLVGETKTIDVEVFNEGFGHFGNNYGQLNASNCAVSSEHYTIDTNDFYAGFAARATSVVPVTYSPKSAGSHTGTVTFTSANGVEFKITMQGVATDPAKIVIAPDTVAVGNLDVDSVAITKEFSIKNEGNYPLEYVFPKFSDRQLETAGGKSSHKYGYSALTNLNGATDFAYDGNPALLDATDVTSTFTDDVKYTGAINLGFEFPFYGKTYSQVHINSLGGLAFSIGEYMYYPPLTESSESIKGIGYISAYGHQLQFGPNSKVSYAKQDGKFVVNYSNVLAVKYDVETSPISFHIALSANGDIEIFYDDYVAMDDMGNSLLFQDGSTLFCGIKDPEGNDALVITSGDIADYWANNDDPAGDVYTQFTTQSAIKFEAPAAYFVTDVAPAYGIVNPGETATLVATVKADDTMYAGETINRLVVESNDPLSATSYVTFSANIVGENLLPVATVESANVDFGQAFRTSSAKKAVTVKNTGKSAFDVTAIAIADAKFTIDMATPFTIEAGMSKDIIITLPTVNEGAVTDVMTITTTVGDLSVQLTGEVIGCPGVELSFTEITETVESGAELSKELTIKNTGDENLVYSIVPGSFTTVTDSNIGEAKVSYIYTSATDDENVKFEWIDIETTGLGERNAFSYYNTHDYVAVELPFEFPFYGEKYNKMYIYNTGFISFTERNDEKIWPEPPYDFPKGSIYTNIIAPYWGMHTMDTNTTAGTYHYMTENEVVVSWMEYGNTMNMGVCFQLIMKKDGSYKFQYKGKGEYAIIYDSFGLAGACSEGGADCIVIPDRLIQFNNAVQFYPVVESTIAAGESKTVAVDVETDKMAGSFTDVVTINTNVPASEKLEIPVNLTVLGVAKPVFPTDTIVEEHVAGYVDMSGPMASMGAGAYDLIVKIGNEGKAAFTITNMMIECDMYTPYPDYPDYTMPVFQYIGYYGMQYDYWGDPMGMAWGVYYGGSFEVGTDGTEIAIPVSYEVASMIGEYKGKLILSVEGLENLSTIEIPFKVLTTDVPYAYLDKPEIRVENATPNYVGTETVTLANMGAYKLTYELRLDPTGEGEAAPEADLGGGIAPMAANKALSAEQLSVLEGLITPAIAPLEKATSTLDGPADFEYNNILYYPALEGASTNTYGTGTTYSEYKAATHYVAPAEGFNISHVYIATTLTNMSDGSKISNADITVEIVAGNDYENGTVIGRGVTHIDEMEGARFLILALDRAVYVNPGQEFYVRISYPVGVEYPAYLSSKLDAVVDNRYMGYVEGYGWFDLAAMFKNQYGSLGYIMSCLETVPGAPWIKMLNADSDKVGTLQPNESLALNFEINAASAPLEKGNKAMLVVKSNDPAQPIINFPIYLDNNAAPEVTAPSQIVYAKEAETTRVEVEVKDVENDDFAIRLDDSGNMSKIQSVTAINGTQAEITIDGNNVSVKNAAEGVKMIIGITPEYGDAGEYTLTVTATDTCILERQATVNYVVEHTNRAPEASTIANISIVEGSSSNVIKFADYFTDPDGDEMTYSMIFTADDIVTAYTTETGVIFYGETVGSVYVAIIATDVNGAESATYFEVTVTELSGIENISINAEVGVYPNPVVETLYVTCDFNSENVNYCIYNENGAVVYNSTCAAAQGEAKAINVSNLADGLYILKVTANGGVATYPIVKQ